jgi:hypothetical protein
MASRNRNRQAPVKDDADEERSIWNQLVVDAKRIDALIVSAAISQLTAPRASNSPRRLIISSGIECKKLKNC